MLAVGLCTAFSGLTGPGLALALLEAGAPDRGVGLLALGVIGLAGVVSRPLRGA